MTTRLSDLELAVNVLPQAWVNLHRQKNVGELQRIADSLVRDLQTAEDRQIIQCKLLILFALIDHLIDGRTAGMVPDYLNW